MTEQPINEAYARLLSATIEHAYRYVPYYHTAFYGLPITLAHPSELSAFPVLSRANIETLGENLLSSERVPDFIRNTSGSTFGMLSRKPLVTYHFQDEVDVRGAILGQNRMIPNIQPLMIRFLSLDHGIDIASNVRGVFSVPLLTPAHFAHIQDLLTRKFNLPGFSSRVRGLVGTLTRLKVVTALLMRAGVQRDDLAVITVNCHSQLLTHRWRKILHTYWGAEVTEIYGISEIPGLIGSRCEYCGFYHLSPAAYVETLHPDTYQPVTMGLARLVATALYPLTQAQPLIRYDTEDLVIVMPPCELTGQRSLEYVGRSSEVVRVGQQLLVNPMYLHNLLDNEKSISVQPNQLARSFNLTDIGFLRYRCQHSIVDDVVEIIIEIEPRWDPQLYPDDAALLSAKIYKEMLRDPTTELKASLDKGSARLRINLSLPGKLTVLSEA